MDFDFGDYVPVPSLSFDPLGTTLSSDLPSYTVPTLGSTGTSPLPDLQSIQRSDGLSFSGILDGVSATANSLIGLYGKVNSIQSNAEMAKFQRDYTKAKMGLDTQVSLGAIDVQKAQILAQQSIEKARAGSATANELARVNSGGGSQAANGFGLSTVIVLGVAIWALTKGKK